MRVFFYQFHPASAWFRAICTAAWCLVVNLIKTLLLMYIFQQDCWGDKARTPQTQYQASISKLNCYCSPIFWWLYLSDIPIDTIIVTLSISSRSLFAFWIVPGFLFWQLHRLSIPDYPLLILWLSFLDLHIHSWLYKCSLLRLLPQWH